MSSQLIVKFAVTGLPESAGLRIRSTEPVGLYISSVDARLAQRYFERVAIELALRRRLLVPEPGGGLKLVKEADWPTAIESGKGEVTISTISHRDAVTLMKAGHPEDSPIQKLIVDWWENGDGEEFSIVRDDSEMVDDWLVESIKSDLEQRPLH